MHCPQCQQANPDQARFCMKCGARLSRTYGQCGTEVPAEALFCFACGEPVGGSVAAPRFAAPGAYTPKHLAERILTSKAALEGECKQVTIAPRRVRVGNGGGGSLRSPGHGAGARPTGGVVGAQERDESSSPAPTEGEVRRGFGLACGGSCRSQPGVRHRRFAGGPSASRRARVSLSRAYA